jgi:hypothetical protein
MAHSQAWSSCAKSAGGSAGVQSGAAALPWLCKTASCTACSVSLHCYGSAGPALPAMQLHRHGAACNTGGAAGTARQGGSAAQCSCTDTALLHCHCTPALLHCLGSAGWQCGRQCSGAERCSGAGRCSCAIIGVQPHRRQCSYRSLSKGQYHAVTDGFRATGKARSDQCTALAFERSQNPRPSKDGSLPQRPCTSGSAGGHSTLRWQCSCTACTATCTAGAMQKCSLVQPAQRAVRLH